jgi:hypothetical protein
LKQPQITNSLFRKQQAQLSTNEDSHAEEEGNDQPEMTRMEIDMARQNFDFYSKSKGGASVELFELPMILTACGYRASPLQLNLLQEFLSNRKSTKLDFAGLQAALT